MRDTRDMKKATMCVGASRYAVFETPSESDADAHRLARLRDGNTISTARVTPSIYLLKALMRCRVE